MLADYALTHKSLVEDFRRLQPIYFASPFTRFERGHTGAYLEVCKLAARVHRLHKLVVFSPIAHCYGMTTHGDLPIIDHSFWKNFNAPFLAVCGAMIVAKMKGWDESFGVCSEISEFRRLHKPIAYLDPESLDLCETGQ